MKIEYINFKASFICIAIATISVLAEVVFRSFYEMQTIGRYAESIAYVLFFCFVIVFSKYKTTSILASMFICLSSLLQMGHYAIYKSWLSAIEIYLFFEKIGEVFNSAKGLASSLYAPIIFFCAILFSIIILLGFRKKETKKIIILDVAFFIVFAFSYAQVSLSKSIQDRAPHIRYSNIKASLKISAIFFGKTLPNQVFGSGGELDWQREPPFKTASTSKKNDSLRNIVLIMGESQNTDNMSVFGYEKYNTTPFLKQINENSIIKRTYALGTYTDVALPSFFNMIEQPNGTAQIYSWKTNIFRLASMNNYKTHLFSAQAANTMTLKSLLGTQYVTNFKDPTSIGYSADQSMYDDEMLPFLKKINLSSDKNFIVIHQIGSHAPYSDRTRNSEKSFGMATLEDEYNNSVHKTDKLIESIYNYLQKNSGDDWLLIYTSDHGQYVKNGSFGHGSLDQKSHYIVPAVIVSPRADVNKTISDNIGGCYYLYHSQISKLIVNYLGYDEEYNNCRSGFVNGARLDGSAGYKKIDIKMDSR